MDSKEKNSLLALAAESIGLQIVFPSLVDVPPRTWPDLRTWDPIDLGNDALNLAASLLLTIEIREDEVEVRKSGSPLHLERVHGDIQAAIRLAITSAAVGLAPQKDSKDASL